MIRIDKSLQEFYDDISGGGHVYICICHGITDHQIRDCVKDGARSMCDLRGQLGVATQCGSCECSAMQILDETLARSPARGMSSSLPSISSLPSPLAAAA